MTLLAWIQSTGVATSIAGSRALTGALSSAHLVGLTLLVGSALVRSLRAFGALLPDVRADQVVGATNRGVALGSAISIATGALLWSARAQEAAANGYFQIKMGLVLTAVVVQVVVASRAASARTRQDPPSPALHGFALLLWFGVVLAGCAFIFVE
jgi:hypothetical protein